MDWNKQENHYRINQPVFDCFHNQKAILREIWRENEYSVWFYRVELENGKLYDIMGSEIFLNPHMMNQSWKKEHGYT